MPVNSLFDKNRKKEIQQGLQSGRYELRKAKIGVPQTDGGPMRAEDIAYATMKAERRKLEKLKQELPPAVQVEEDPEDPREMVRKIASELGVRAKDFQAVLLTTSIVGGNLERVRIAHQNGADLNADFSSAGILDADGRPCRTALQIARAQGRQDIVSYLRKHGAKG